PGMDVSTAVLTSIPGIGKKYTIRSHGTSLIPFLQKYRKSLGTQRRNLKSTLQSYANIAIRTIGEKFLTQRLNSCPSPAKSFAVALSPKEQPGIWVLGDSL